MYRYIKSLLFLFASFLAILFVIFVINQTNQFYSLATGIHPLLGKITLFTLLAVYVLLIIIPLYALFKRPIALFPPEKSEGEAYRVYLNKLSKRLARNPLIEKESLDPRDPATLEEALKVLDKEADGRIKEAASAVFIMTAISQYGALDAAIVALAQLRMIWQVTILYNQRPGLRDLVYLYSNVFATSFLATKIENLDLLEDQLEPVIASIMGSSLSSMTPAFNAAATVITNSIIQGSANAFLTLRVGVITKKYCSSLVRPERSALRRIAAVQAATLLATVVGESAYNVTKAVIRATAKTGKRPFAYGQKIVTKTSQKTRDMGKETMRKSEELAKNISDTIKKSSIKLKRYFIKKDAESHDELE